MTQKLEDYQSVVNVLLVWDFRALHVMTVKFLTIPMFVVVEMVISVLSARNKPKTLKR
jgi:hypothetical protein